MKRRPPIPTLTDPFFPVTTLSRSSFSLKAFAIPYQPRVAIRVPAAGYGEHWHAALARKTAALTAAGLAVEPRTWTDPGDLSGFDLILPLLAWGYPRAIARWYALLDRLEAEGLPVVNPVPVLRWNRSEEHTSELQSLMRISYACFCLKK